MEPWTKVDYIACAWEPEWYIGSEGKGWIPITFMDKLEDVRTYIQYQNEWEAGGACWWTRKTTWKIVKRIVTTSYEETT